jgi:hypothetical protein
VEGGLAAVAEGAQLKPAAGRVRWAPHAAAAQAS